MLNLILPLVIIMLWLLLSIEGERYALESSSVLEVLPWTKLQVLQQAPPIVAGLLSYRSHSIPIVDLSQILYGRVSRLHICTRIILMQRSIEAGTVNPAQPPEIVGFLVEQVSHTRRIAVSHQEQIQTPVSRTPFVATILSEPQGVIQCLALSALWTAIQSTLRQDNGIGITA
jgi:chemotaxis-related protein WspB